MNLAHRRLCRSAYWRKAVETYILPWALDGLDIGANVLEVGPGPGVTTDLLRGRVERLTCVEIDRAFADSLSRRMQPPLLTRRGWRYRQPLLPLLRLPPRVSSASPCGGRQGRRGRRSHIHLDLLRLCFLALRDA